MLHGALKRVNSITIYHDDLESVQPGAFMTDTIIDVFSSLLATDDTKVVLGAIFFHLMTDGGWDSVHAMFGIQAPLGLQTKLLIIPVHTSNPEHWSLLVRRASLQKEGSFELFYIDSLNNFEQFQKVVKIIEQTPLLSRSTGDTITCIEVLKQKETECGACTCLYMFLSITNALSAQFIRSILPSHSIRHLYPCIRKWVKYVLDEENIVDPFSDFMNIKRKREVQATEEKRQKIQQNNCFITKTGNDLRRNDKKRTEQAKKVRKRKRLASDPVEASVKKIKAHKKNGKL